MRRLIIASAFISLSLRPVLIGCDRATSFLLTTRPSELSAESTYFWPSNDNIALAMSCLETSKQMPPRQQ